MLDTGNKFDRDHEVLEKLYKKFAWGGVRVPVLFQTFRFYSKKAIWALLVQGTLAFKRALDVIGSALGLILLAPILLLTAWLIKREDGGSVIFSQERVGKRGKIFRMYKFRSMVIDAEARKNDLWVNNEAGEIIFKMRKDPRITRVGRFMRRFSIDEAPQLYNVLKGDMSLVGPRPALPHEVNQYSISERLRLEVIPGITGLWQIKGRSEIDFRGQVRLDVQYIESQSFWGDVVILLKTIPAVLSGRGAY